LTRLRIMASHAPLRGEFPGAGLQAAVSESRNQRVVTRLMAAAYLLQIGDPRLQIVLEVVDG